MGPIASICMHKRRGRKTQTHLRSSRKSSGRCRLPSSRETLIRCDSHASELSRLCCPPSPPGFIAINQINQPCIESKRAERRRELWRRLVLLNGWPDPLEVGVIFSH
uniref:Uncharacterized protein n=1 Tax=Oryza meridionalis TaxID=40149 RepID=A0A0E0CMP5_9ORYZ